MIRARDAGGQLVRDMAYTNVRLTYSPAWLWEPVYFEGGLTICRRARVE